MQRTAAGRALHQHQGLGQPHLQAVAQREMAGAARGSLWQFAHQQALLPHRRLQLGVMTRVDAIERCAEHSHRLAAGFEAAAMGFSIDAFGQPTHHRPTGLGQGSADQPRHREAVARGPACAHNRHGLAGSKGAP